MRSIQYKLLYMENQEAFFYLHRRIQASERATMQRSLDEVSGFSNAPDCNRQACHFSSALEAVKRLVIGQLPPLLSAAREEVSSDDSRRRGADASTATTDDEVVKMLQLEWQKRESRCLSDAATWDEELKVSSAVNK